MINNIICIPKIEHQILPTYLPTYSPTCLYVANSPSIIQSVLDYYSVAPEFVGTAAEVALETLADGTQVPMAI